MIYKSPKATVGAILFHPEKGKSVILLTKRNIDPFKNYWCFPGGHVEEYEEILPAVKREIKEETNLEFNPDFLDYSEEIFPEINLHNVALFFYGEAQGELIKEDAEVSDISWFTLEDALNLNLAFNHKSVLLKYKNHFNL